MIAVLVFVGVVVAVAAPMCGHQGQPWPLKGAWGRLRGAVRAADGFGGHPAVRASERRSERRRAIREPRRAPAVRPSRPHSRRCDASQGAGGGFPVPVNFEASHGRTELSIKEAA